MIDNLLPRFGIESTLVDGADLDAWKNAVRDNTKASIMEAFQRRIDSDRDTEFAEACRQVERIAELRLLEKFGA